MGILVLLLGLSVGGAPTIYQCKVDGVTVYSDHPCGQDSKKVAVSPSVTRMVHRRDPAPTPAPASQPEGVASGDAGSEGDSQLRCPSALEIKKAIVLNQVKLCMTTAQVEDAVDVHHANHLVKISVYDGERYVRWFFPRHVVTWPTYIRFRNGRVVGWSKAPQASPYF